MENFLRSVAEVITVTAPIFVVIAIGYFIRRKKIIKEQSTIVLNKLAYNLGLPSLIFISLTKHKLSDIFNLKLVEVVYSAIFLFIIMISLFYYFIKTDAKTKGAMIVSSFRCNMAFMGFPVLLSAYGTLAVAKASLVVAFMMPFNITATILIFKFFSRREKKTHTGKLFLNLLRDPLILAAVLGIVVSYFNLNMSSVVINVFDILSGMAVALALLSIGASFKFFHIRKNIKLLSVVSFVKLILLPAVGLFFSIFVFKLGGFDRNIICILLSMPLAVVTFIMGKEHNSDHDFISSALILTTIISAITISGWLLALKLLDNIAIGY